jgi:hypothetical protein
MIESGSVAVDGISDNEHRLSVLRPTTPHPVIGLPSITVAPVDIDADAMRPPGFPR